MSFVYDKETVETLKKSKEIGCLQRVIIEKGTRRVLVGRHRKFADPDWPEKQIKVKDDLHRELIILNGNVQRVVSQEETKMRLTRIARILEDKGTPPEKVCVEMAKLPIPYTPQHIRRLLPNKYKTQAHATRKKPSKQFGNIGSQNIPQGLTQEGRCDFERLERNIQLLSETNPLPFSDCRCKICPHKETCY